VPVVRVQHVPAAQAASRMGVLLVIQAWTPNPSAPLWWPESAAEPHGPHFHHLTLSHIKQQGPTCVPTTLAMLASATGTSVSPEDMMPKINSQAPHTWSAALKPFGMQLAYCNVDVRRASDHVDALLALDDLFLLSFYSGEPPFEPEVPGGKLCTAHIVTVHRDLLIDTARPASGGGVVPLHAYNRLHNPTKRVFRVVPAGHPRSV